MSYRDERTTPATAMPVAETFMRFRIPDGSPLAVPINGQTASDWKLTPHPSGLPGDVNWIPVE